jgi:hypothetical protein
MKTNEHMIDRALRVIAGLILITLAATGTIGVWGWIGILPLVTGIVVFVRDMPSSASAPAR